MPFPLPDRAGFERHCCARFILIGLVLVTLSQLAL